MAGKPERASWSELLNPQRLELIQQLGLFAVLALFVLPVVVPTIWADYLAGALFFATWVMSWDFVSGYTGEISFGHALFFGVGGYTSGMLNLHHGVDPWIAAPVGALAAGAAGLLIGFPSLRVKGPYFSLITLVTPLIVISVFRFFPDLTGGELGLISVGSVDSLSGIGPIPSPGFDPYAGYYLALAVFLLSAALFLAITRADAGVVFTAIRADEVALAATGKNPAKFKLFAFVVSGLVGGFAGAMYGHSIGGFTPNELLGLIVSIEVIIVAILGGMGTIVGALVGALLLGITETIVTSLNVTIPIIDITIADTAPLPTFALGILVLVFMPEGVVPKAIETGRGYLARRRGEAPPDSGGISAAKSTISSYREEIEDVLGRENQ